MEKKTKKRLLIAGMILVTVAVIGTVVLYFGVNMAFSKVTQTISDSDLLKDGNGEVELPVVSTGDENAESVQVELTPEVIRQLESKISVADKFAVLMILKDALPASEYDKMLGLLTGGVSQNEISEAYAMMRENLTQEQKDQIKGYYAKYMHLLDQPEP